MVRVVYKSALLVIGLALVGGCSEDLTDVPDTIDVTGTITFNSSPLPDADVIFFDGTEYTAFGKTDGTGRYTLKTRFNSVAYEKGAPARKYKVTVSKLVPPGGMTEEEYQAKKTALRTKRESGQKITPEDLLPQKVEMIPPRYSQAERTELEATVKFNQENDFPFNLTK